MVEQDTFVKTELVTRASEELSKEVADEINKKEEPEKSTAAFREALKDQNE